MCKSAVVLPPLLVKLFASQITLAQANERSREQRARECFMPFRREKAENIVVIFLIILSLSLSRFRFYSCLA
jgi:hypothetical protein